MLYVSSVFVPQVKDSVKGLRDDVTEDIWTLTNDLTYLKEEEWVHQVDRRMKQFEQELITTMR